MSSMEVLLALWMWVSSAALELKAVSAASATTFTLGDLFFNYFDILFIS